MTRPKNAESMNADLHLEHRAGSSQGKHEGEPSLGLCDRLNLTRDNSQRQLPADHDYAVSTREYQTDQSSLKTAPTAARSVFGKRQKQRQRQKQLHCFRRVDTVTPYQTRPEWFKKLEMPPDAWENTDEGKRAMQEQAEWDQMRKDTERS
jgi:hypothetical protein